MPLPIPTIALTQAPSSSLSRSHLGHLMINPLQAPSNPGPLKPHFKLRYRPAKHNPHINHSFKLLLCPLTIASYKPLLIP